MSFVVLCVRTSRRSNTWQQAPLGGCAACWMKIIPGCITFRGHRFGIVSHTCFFSLAIRVCIILPRPPAVIVNKVRLLCCVKIERFAVTICCCTTIYVELSVTFWNSIPLLHTWALYTRSIYLSPYRETNLSFKFYSNDIAVLSFGL